MAKLISLKEANIYGGLFISDGRHITYNFAPGSEDSSLLPPGVKEGDEGTVEYLGLYLDDDIVCFHVRIYTEEQQRVITHQDNGRTLLHITVSSGTYKPVEAGRKLTDILDASTYQEQMAKAHYYAEFNMSLRRKGTFKIVKDELRMKSKGEPLK